MKDARATRRMLALALVLDGRSRTEAAQSCGMDRQTLRDWVHRYNAEGLAGLVDRPLPGRPPRLSAEQMRELAVIVETGCRVALKWGHPQFVWCRGSIRALSKFGPARPYIARFKVFNRLIWPSA